LRQGLTDALALIEAGEKEDKSLLDDIKAFSHSRKKYEFDTLMRTLAHATAGEAEVCRLLRLLYDHVRIEAYTLRSIEKKLANPNTMNEGRKRIQGFIMQCHIENEMAERIRELAGNGRFHVLYKNLTAGARRIHELDEEEHRLAKAIRGKIDTMTNAKKNLHLYNDPASPVEFIVAQCVRKMEGWIMTEIARHDAEGTDDRWRLDQHDYVDFEFVNSPAFINFVHEEVMQGIFPPSVDDAWIKIFVYAFRESYNKQA
jgi:hypothetical protein